MSHQTTTKRTNTPKNFLTAEEAAAPPTLITMIWAAAGQIMSTGRIVSSTTGVAPNPGVRRRTGFIANVCPLFPVPRELGDALHTITHGADGLEEKLLSSERQYQECEERMTAFHPYPGVLVQARNAVVDPWNGLIRRYDRFLDALRPEHPQYRPWVIHRQKVADLRGLLVTLLKFEVRVCGRTRSGVHLPCAHLSDYDLLTLRGENPQQRGDKFVLKDFRVG